MFYKTKRTLHFSPFLGSIHPKTLWVTGKKRTGKKHIGKKRTGKKGICI